jgi:hypothetical protein
VDNARVFLILFMIFAMGSVALLTPPLGQDFFPGRRRPVQDSRARPHRNAH